MQPGRHPALVDPGATTEHGGDLAPDRHRVRGLAPGEHDGQRLVLGGKVAVARRVDVADLEEPCTDAPMRFVEGDGSEQAGTQRCAQHALVGHQRVGDRDRRSVEPRFGERVGCEERVRHRLGDAEPEQHVAQDPPALLAHRQAPVVGRGRHPRAEPVVAVVAGDLLDHVDLGGRVETPGRQGDGSGVARAGDGVADRVEQLRQVVGVEVGAEDPIDVGDAHLDGAVLGREVLTAGVDRAGVDDEVRAGFGEQFGKPGDRRRHAVRVDAALEPL